MREQLRLAIMYYAETPSSLLISGIFLLFVSSPTLAVILSNKDGVVPLEYYGLREAAILAGCSIFLAGVILIFLGVRKIAAVGSTIYWMTHPRWLK